MRHKQKQPKANKSGPFTRSGAKSNEGNIEDHVPEVDETIIETTNIENDVSFCFEDNFSAPPISNLLQDIDPFLTYTDKSLPDYNIYCYSSCEKGRKYDREMIQCTTCMTWYHTECSDAGSKPVTTWNCNTCRCVPELINILRSEVKEIHNIMSVFIEKQNEMYQSISIMTSKNNDLAAKIKLLESENYNLRMHKYNSLAACSSSPSSSDSSDDDSVMEPHISSLRTPEQNQINIISDDSSPNVNPDLPNPSVPNIRINKKYRPHHRKGSYSVPKPSFDQRNFSPVSNKNFDISTPSVSQKPKVTLFGGSMVRNIGSSLSAGLLDKDTTCAIQIWVKDP